MSNGRKFRRNVAKGGVVFVLPDIPDDAPARLREGLARRRICAITGRCPCGAEFTMPDHVEPGSVTLITVEHETDCPATNEAIAECGWVG